MDHVVYVDAKARELQKLLHEGKSMIIWGAAGRRMRSFSDRQKRVREYGRLAPCWIDR